MVSNKGDGFAGCFESDPVEGEWIFRTDGTAYDPERQEDYSFGFVPLGSRFQIRRRISSYNFGVSTGRDTLVIDSTDRDGTREVYVRTNP